jgi:drug/metabolite transporter (DMT)-like permease
VLLALVLVSAVLHASWNALLRGHPDRRGGSVAVLAVCAISSVIAAAAAIAIEGDAPFPTLAALGATLAAGVFEAGYFAALNRGLAAGGLGPVYTISRGGAVVLVWPISVALFGEPVGALALGGSAVLLLGLAIAGLERSVPRAAAAWAALTAACIAGYHLFYKAALADGASAFSVFGLSILIAVPLQALALRVPAADALAALRASPRRTIGAGVISTASFLIFLVALEAGGAGVVLTLRNTSVVFALGFAALLGEHPSRRQILGALVVVTGAALVGLQG